MEVYHDGISDYVQSFIFYMRYQNYLYRSTGEIKYKSINKRSVTDLNIRTTFISVIIQNIIKLY